ncbi:MAG TPA: polysaccharide deacetylase family protein [Chitinophaga sp.]
MDIIFELLDKHQQPATFFCIGWIAERYPEVIRRIAKYNYDIACHSYMHQLVYELSPAAFKEDTYKAIDILRQVSGQKINAYRAPGFSIMDSNLWAFEILQELGIEVDSSVFPAQRAHGGLPDFTSATPSVIHYKGGALKEFPLNTHSFAGVKWVFSGGGYFRAFPYGVIKRWTKESDYMMTYFHPRDFDKEQPVLPDLSLLRRFKCYYGLDTTYLKLDKLLDSFKFTDIRSAVDLIDWPSTAQIKLG